MGASIPGLPQVRSSQFESKKKSVAFIKACYNLGSARTISVNERETDMRTHVKETQLAARIVSDPRWAKIVARDKAADGSFYYAVKTTGVYCRPSCPARLARPEHVQFHATCADAEKAGFRPCKRCQPNQPALAEQHAAMIAEACRLIADAEEAPDLEALA